MFYSKDLLSKKGPFGTVWVAAFCGEAALSRSQVARTDIVASVEKILSDVKGPRRISQRILAQLLFGIVRIYSKKVHYLYLDCEEIRSLQLRLCVEPSVLTGGSTRGPFKQANKAVRAGRSVAGHQNTSMVKKTVHAVRTEVSSPVSSEGLSIRVETEVIVRTSVVIQESCLPDDLPTFMRPKRFELDSFDLGIAEDTDDEGEDHHQLAPQDILLEDERHRVSYFYESYQRASCSYDVDSTCFMPEYIAVPHEVMLAISEANNILDSSTKGDKPERESQNADSAWFTPVKDVLPPDMMDMVCEATDPSDKSKTRDNSIRQLNMDETNGGSTCSMAPIPQQESQEGHNSENIENNTCGSLCENNLSIEASGNNSLLKKSNTTPPAAEFSEHNTGEHESPEAPVLSCETGAENELPPSTPEPLPEGVPGPSSSSRFRVRTPAKTEKSQATRKRRVLYDKADYIPTEREGKRRVRRRLTWPLCDEVTVLSNMIMRAAIDDASDLVRHIRKVPHTHLDSWKVAKVGSLPYSFMDPVIPYKTSTPLACFAAPEAPESLWEESVNARRRLSYEHAESVHCCKDTGSTERESILDASRKRKLDEGIDFEASVGCHTENGPVHNEDTAKEKGPQVEGDKPRSEIPPMKGLHESENQCLLHNEALNAALDTFDEDISNEEPTRDEGLLNSTRTRPLRPSVRLGLHLLVAWTREYKMSSGAEKRIANCLHKLFLDQKSKDGTNTLSLNQVLEGTKRRTSASFFYETLILNSRGLLQVNQEQPYADIILSATPQLEAEVQRCGN